MEQAPPNRQVTHRSIEGKTGPRQVGSDEEVLAALARGDRRTALALLIKAHGSVIHRYCHRILRSQALADDVHQSVFIQAFEDLGAFAGRSTFRSWLHSIARHRCLDAAKARRRFSHRFVLSDDPVDDLDPDLSSEDRLVAKSIIEALERCLDELPPHVRAAVLLRHKEGLTFDEMSRACEERPATLQARVARALPLLRRSLEARGITPSQMAVSKFE
jgi:RNA polymerase sigma-70 factor (ECF subfamily)